RQPVVFEFPAPVTVDGYRFATANDFEDRDPISWLIHGSDDGVSWDLLDVRTNQEVPVERHTYTETRTLPDAVPPLIRMFETHRGDFGGPLSVVLNDLQDPTFDWVTENAESVTLQPGDGEPLDVPEEGTQAFTQDNDSDVTY